MKKQVKKSPPLFTFQNRNRTRQYLVCTHNSTHSVTMKCTLYHERTPTCPCHEEERRKEEDRFRTVCKLSVHKETSLRSQQVGTAEARIDYFEA